MTDGETYPFEALYRLSRALHQDRLDTRQIMQRTLVLGGKIAGVEQGCIITFQDGDDIQNAYILNTGGATEEESAELWETLLERGVMGFVYHAHRAVVIHDIQADPRWPKLPNSPTVLTQGSALGLPLYRGETVFGVLMFMHAKTHFFDAAKTAILEEVAGLAADALINALSYVTDKHSAADYEALFDEAIVPVVLTDLNGQILAVNQRGIAMLGYEREELLRRPITTINRIDSSPWETEGLNSLKPDRSVAFRTVAIDAKGKEIPVVLRVRRIQLGVTEVVEWMEQDISVQAQIDQLRRDLSAMVYHDLRGPLSSIQGSIHKLAQVLANHENPAVLTFLQIGIRSIRQLRRMIDSLLDVERLEEGNTILNRNPIELRVVLADAIQLVQPLAIDANQNLKFEWPQDLPMLDIDSDMVLRVITNLLENAIKHTPEGGEIVLGARMMGENQVAISVRDSGQGIPKDLQDIIFDKFSRVKHKDAPKGVGLGLAFCRLAVDAHGGDIWVESDSGAGAEFIFTLPLNLPPTDDASVTELATTAS